jgi:GH24 family phage-related lysozyme (muramidase)
MAEQKPDPGTPQDVGTIDAATIMQANFGAAVARTNDADPPAAVPFTTVAFDVQKALDFLKACETSTPRVTYGLGAKCRFNAVPGRDFTEIDCSGFVRECVRRATDLGNTFPDGSVVQHDWVRAHGFAPAAVADGKLADGGIRIAFLPVTAQRKIGHVVLLYKGNTIESHGGVGPDSRPWTGTQWQAETDLYVLSPQAAAPGAQPFSLASRLASAVIEPQPSEKAIALIIFFEVTDQATYEHEDRHTTWAGGASGVTIGIGYDVGYISKGDLHADWAGVIPDGMLAALDRAVGVKGIAAKTLAQQLAGEVDVSWEAANQVFRGKTVPALARQVAAALPNSRELSADSFGALVSLAYNRGVTFDSDGDRYREMRNIKADMIAKKYSDIPAEIRSMKRLWPNTPGLQDRREKEARLFEQGLAAASA